MDPLFFHCIRVTDLNLELAVQLANFANEVREHFDPLGYIAVIHDKKKNNNHFHIIIKFKRHIKSQNLRYYCIKHFPKRSYAMKEGGTTQQDWNNAMAYLFHEHATDQSKVIFHYRLTQEEIQDAMARHLELVASRRDQNNKENMFKHIVTQFKQNHSGRCTGDMAPNERAFNIISDYILDYYSDQGYIPRQFILENWILQIIRRLFPEHYKNFIFNYYFSKKFSPLMS
jgi:hypothetical protein